MPNRISKHAWTLLSLATVTTLACSPLVACSDAASNEETGDTTSTALRAPDAEEAKFLSLLNAYRASVGAGPLVATPLLNQVAYDHSLDMAQNGYFDHTDRSGGSPFDRMAAAGYHGGAMAENIAAGNETAQATFDQWKGSAGHDANMREGRYKAIGIGRAYVAGSPYRWYWTTDFGDVIDPSAGSDPGGANDAGALDAGAPDATPLPPPPPAACTGASEAEPNDGVATANPLGDADCGALTAGDSDWFTWSVNAANVPYAVKLAASGDARIQMWKRSGTGYASVRQASPTEIANTSSSAGTYVVRVASLTGAAQTYRLTLSR